MPTLQRREAYTWPWILGKKVRNYYKKLLEGEEVGKLVDGNKDVQTSDNKTN